MTDKLKTKDLTIKKKYVYLEKFERTKEAIKNSFFDLNKKTLDSENKIKGLEKGIIDLNQELKSLGKSKFISDIILALVVISIVFCGIVFNVVLNSL